MTTTVTRYVNTAADAGGNGTTRDLTGANCAYQTFNAAQAAEAKDISTGTGSDEIFEFLCAGASEGGVTQSCTMAAGWTVDATGYIIVGADIAHPTSPQMHDGTVSTSLFHFRYAGSGGGIILPTTCTHVVFKNLQFYPNDAGANTNRKFVGVQTTGSYAVSAEFENCIFDGGRVTTDGSCGVIGVGSNSYHKFRNCLFKNFNTGGATPGMGLDTLGIWKIHNCTFYNCAVAIDDGTSSFKSIVKNCLFYQNTNDTRTFTDLVGSNNSTTNATGIGTSPRTSQTFTFADTSYRLASNDAGALGFGTDLSGDADYPVTTDWEGDARDGSTPDIGWDEYVAATDQFTEHLIRVYV